MSYLSRMVKKEKIPLWKRILIHLLGKYRAFKTDPYGYGNLEYFYGFCKEHGYYIDYLHGQREELRCPKCEVNFLKQNFSYV